MWSPAKTACPPLVLICLLGVACSAPDAPEPASPSAEDRAAAALVPLKQQLMGELTRALGDGPVAALDVCRVRAQEITRDLGSGDVQVGRTSHRVRNPANTPEPWIEPLLNAYLDDPTDRGPKTVSIDERTSGYVEPIVLMPMCLPCHGTDLDFAVREKIAELYPDDQATGFAAGDLRGLFWATVPADGGS